MLKDKTKDNKRIKILKERVRDISMINWGKKIKRSEKKKRRTNI